MTITYRNDGPWGSGKGSRLTSTEADNNFYDLASRVGVIEDLPVGVFIEDITFTGATITFHLSDDTTRGPFPLPVALFNPVGAWANDTPYNYLDLVTVPTLGLYVVMVAHTTPSAPAEFDPNEVSDSDGDLLYRIVVPLNDLNYDIGLSVTGTMLRDPGTLICKIVLPRAVRLSAGLVGAYAHLGTESNGGESGTAATSLSLGIYQNATQIGTITFEAGENPDGFGGQFAAIVFVDDVEFEAGDRLRIVTIVADDDGAADLSISIPSTRLDI